MCTYNIYHSEVERYRSQCEISKFTRETKLQIKKDWSDWSTVEDRMCSISFHCHSNAIHVFNICARKIIQFWTVYPVKLLRKRGIFCLRSFSTVCGFYRNKFHRSRLFFFLLCLNSKDNAPRVFRWSATSPRLDIFFLRFLFFSYDRLFYILLQLALDVAVLSFIFFFSLFYSLRFPSSIVSISSSTAAPIARSYEKTGFPLATFARFLVTLSCPRFAFTRYRHFVTDFKKFRTLCKRYKTFSLTDPSLLCEAMLYVTCTRCIVLKCTKIFIYSNAPFSDRQIAC